MRKVLLVFTALLLGSNILGFGQTLVNKTYNPVPLAPTAAALAQYAQVPVSLATGSPEVAVPLYTLQCGQLSLPLSLSYHSGGLKVSEHASWVGLGWTLNAGGVIARTIRGKRDNGEFTTYFGPYQQTDPQPNIPQDYQLLEQLANGADFDGLPDLYSFNFMGRAGTFIDVANTVSLFPPQPLKLSRISINAASPTADANQWVAVDETGNSYWFDAKEITEHPNGSNSGVSDITSWYLTKVVSGSKQDTIYFDYQDYTHLVPTIEEETFTVDLTGFFYVPRPDTHITTRQISNSSAFPIHGKYLSQIRFATGRIALYSSLGRVDLADERRLDSLVVFNGGMTRSFVFSYVTPTTPNERLKLATVAERPSRGQAGQVLTHRFRYHSRKMPASTLSKAQDHWGYYNGKNNQSLLPPIPPYPPLDPAIPILPNAGDRSPDPAFAQADLLTRITYPSGGYAAFAYEGHDYGAVPVLPTSPVELSRVLVTAQSPMSGSPLSPTVTTTFTVALEQDVLITAYSQVAVMNAQRYPARIYRCGETSCEPPQAQLVYTCGLVGISAASVGGSAANPKRQLLHLEPGEYTLKAISADGGEVGIVITGVAPTGEPAHLPYAGGVRLRADTLHDGLAHVRDVVRTYSYRVAGLPTASSGVVACQPNYRSTVLAMYGTEGGGLYVPPQGDVAVYHAVNIYPLNSDIYSASSQSSLGGACPIYYAHVAVTTASGAGGATHYYYTEPDVNASSPSNYPSVPANIGSRTQPQLVQQVELTSAGDTVRRVLNRYELLPSSTRQCRGFVWQSTPVCETYQGSYPEPSCPRVYNLRSCFMLSRFEYLAERREYQYGAGKLQRTVTRYAYGNPAHLQPTRVQQVLGAGDTLTTLTRYPLDYLAGSSGTPDEATSGLRALRDRHYVTTPVEQVQWRSVGGNRLVVAGVLSRFKALALPNRSTASPFGATMGTIPVLNQELSLSIATPMTFTPAMLSGVSGGITFQQASAYEPRLQYERYDRRGNPAMVRKVSDVPTAYWWSTQRLQPVAVVRNGTPETCAYTGFEWDTSFGWDYELLGDQATHYISGGRTGDLAYRLNGQWGVSRDSLPAGTYELTLWAQAGQAPILTTTRVSTAGVQQVATGPNGWYQFRWRLSCEADAALTIDVSGTSSPMLIDDVRLHPIKAQMTTYTHDPLLGLTSQTDATGRIIRYEYDGLGRLLRARDEQNQIQAQQEYHYARP